jgi:hypothetical protein
LHTQRERVRIRWNESRSLPEWVERGYDILAAAISESAEEQLPRDQAQRVLRDHEEFPDETADAEYAIDRLLETGWLYEVECYLRVTEPPD